MRHFPVFVDLHHQRVVVVGGGDTAIAKLRLLLKTPAEIVVVAQTPAPLVRQWAAENKLTLLESAPQPHLLSGARLVYSATDNDAVDAQIAQWGKELGILTNWVDNLGSSDFITPAMVDRDPVVVAIGTEGTAPVLARQIKAEVENLLAPDLGILARLAAGFRTVAGRLRPGAPRRRFWSAFFADRGPAALRAGGEQRVRDTLWSLFREVERAEHQPGSVAFVGAGPGDPELLTLKARKLLHGADVVLHDRLVDPSILELARREAVLVEVGKTGYGPSWKQDDINALMIEHAGSGAQVVRLKSGDPAVFGRLDEETAALAEAQISFTVVAGITTASAAAASLGVSLTQRRRNSALSFLTGRDIDNFAEQDWVSLAKPGAVAAIYMGSRAAEFLRGRLLMHGADPATPVTVMENVSRANQQTIAATLMQLPEAISSANLSGPAIVMFGLAPAAAQAELGAQTLQTGT